MNAVSLAEFLNGTLEFLSGENFDVRGFAPLHAAEKDQVTFFVGDSVSGELRTAKAGLVIVSQDFVGAPTVRALLRVKNPYASMVRVVEKFFENSAGEEEPFVANSAKIHPSAVVEGSVGEGSVVGPNCVIMRGASVGKNSRLEANVTIYGNVKIGDSCVFQAGAVVGSRGFGFFTDEDGIRRPVPHLSGVRIGNGCEFGANSVVAAGFLAPTTIGNDCHFDSFVQIGHNCTVGNGILMASQSGLGGTTVVEDGAEFAGGAQIAGHLTIGKGAVIAAKAGVTKSVPAGAVYAGFPSEPIERWRKGIVALRKLSK